MITYKWANVGNNENVFLDKEYVGTIKRVKGGWKYFPKGSKAVLDAGGEIFKNLSECEDSLEGE